MYFDTFCDICYKTNIMEIREIISYHLNSDTNILEVCFKTIEDDEDNQRIDHIDYTFVSEYGYQLEDETFGFFAEDDDDVEEHEENVELDEELLISFLNEYYLLNPKLFPKSEIY